MAKHTKHRNFQRASVLAAAIGAGAMFTHMAAGASYTWTGTTTGTTSNWGTNANWSPSGIPDNSADIVNLGGMVSGATGTMTVNTTSRQVGTLMFTRNGSATLNATGGAGLTLNTGITAAAPASTARSYFISAPITLAANNTWNVDSTVGATTLTVSSVITNSSAKNLTKTGSGMLVLSNAANTYSGVTSILGGTLSINTFAIGGAASGIGNSGSLASNLIIDGGALQFTGSAGTTNRLFTLGANGGIIEVNNGPATFNNSGAMAFTGSGARTLTLSGDNTGTLAAVIGNSGTDATSLVKAGSGKWILTGVNTFSGATTINDGTLSIGVNNSLSNSTVVTVNGGALDMGADHSNAIGGLTLLSGELSGSGTSALTLNAGSYDLRSGTVSVPLNGSAGLYKTTTSTVALEASNGNTGETKILGGILSLDTSGGALTGSSTISIMAGGSLRLNNTSGSTTNDDRVKDTADISLTSGTFEYVGRGNSVAGSRSDESIKRLNFVAGASTLTIGNSSKANGSSTIASLTITDATDGLVRNPGATMQFVDDSADAHVSVTKHTESNGMIGAWALYDTSNWASLSGTNTGDIVSYDGSYEQTTTQNNWAAADNVRLSSGSNFTVTANKTVYSLIEASSTSRTHTINNGATLTLDSGGLVFANVAHTINGPGNLTAGSAGGYELIVHTTSGNTGTIGAAIVNGASPVSLTKSGIGVLKLTGANTYTGPTYVSQGILQLSSLSNNISASSMISIQNGATLDVSLVTGGFKLGTNQKLKGDGSVLGNVTADAVGSTIAPGNSPGKLTFNGNLALTSNATYEVQIGGASGDTGTAGVDFDQILINGSSKVFTMGGATLKVLPLPGIVANKSYKIVSTSGGATVNFSNFFAGLTNGVQKHDGILFYTVTATSSDVSISFSTVPEPTSIGLIAVGACGLLKRRRRNAAK